MDWINFFTREERVAGLEISGDFLRLALLGENKDKKLFVVTTVEEPLKDGIIVDGVLKNKEKLGKAIKKLIGKSKVRIRYVILSIPGNKIFSKIFSFPKSINGEKLKETMDLSIGFQLPIKPENAYLDWEKIEGEIKNEVLLAAIPKSIINEYVSALAPTGLKIIAVEFHLLSIARTLVENDKPTLVLLDKEEMMTVGVIKNNVLRFIYTISYETTPKNKLKTELKRIINFYEGEYESLSKIIVLNKKTVGLAREVSGLKVENFKIIEPFASAVKVKSDAGRWLISAGAAKRGVMPRKEDTLVSLMPVGTENAYEYQKAITFAKLMADIVTVASVIFLAVFLGAWIMMLSIQQSLNNQHDLFSSLPVSTETAELEIRAKHLNYLVSQTDEIIKSTPMWSGILGEIRTRLIQEVIISNVVINSPETSILMQGTAKNRDAINTLKKMFEASSFFTSANVPLTNLEKKTDVPFSIVFQLKEPKSVYLK